MTIADRLREEGRNDGLILGKREEALRIAQEMLERGLDRGVSSDADPTFTRGASEPEAVTSVELYSN